MPTVADIFKTMEYGPAPEAGKPGVEWVEAHQPFGLYIGGEWRKPSSGDYFNSTNPASGKVIARIAKGNSADVDTAVAAAGAAFETWSKTPGHVRARYLYAIARHIQKHSRLLAVLESLDIAPQKRLGFRAVAAWSRHATNESALWAMVRTDPGSSPCPTPVRIP